MKHPIQRENKITKLSWNNRYLQLLEVLIKFAANHLYHVNSLRCILNPSNIIQYNFFFNQVDLIIVDCNSVYYN